MISLDRPDDTFSQASLFVCRFRPVHRRFTETAGIGLISCFRKSSILSVNPTFLSDAVGIFIIFSIFVSYYKSTYLMKSIRILLFLTALISLPACADEKPARVMQYFPDGRDIVCINGTNRYTRALYGTHTRFRLETSDRPVFATYDKEQSRNFRLYLVNNGNRLRLDSAEWCEARYRGGQRSYVVRDASWGANAELRIVVLASQFREGAIWQFILKGFSGDVQLQCRMSPVAKWKMERDGDLGLEPRSSYEASADPKVEKRISWRVGNESYLTFTNPDGIASLAPEDGREEMQKELSALEKLTSQVEFTTPDPFINTLGANFMAAADGLWDGSTWLHGCIGWRMPLAGWRAAYLADAFGWGDRAVSHFDAYAASQVTNVPVIYPQPAQDTTMNLARAEKKWGTPMYSNGYICRLPNRNDVMNHYDMNLNYVDELLWHFQYDADTAYMRRMWPLLKLHLAWEKRNWDVDGDHLYDGYCCIWASDALYYNGGGATHSSAYNYRGNRLAARIAELIGEDSTPYKREAEAILQAMNTHLWVKSEGHWAEFKDYMGLKRVHKQAALWSIYTPIDCGVGTPEQADLSTRYVDRYIPHIPVRLTIPEKYRQVTSGPAFDLLRKPLYTLPTTDWMPYDWSTNNVAHEEVMNMALAYFEAGRSDSGFNLLMADLIDGQYLGQSPGNFGQISYYDKVRSEAYRDFGDNVGVSARAVVNGLFGVLPEALDGRCVIKPAWPESWDSVTFRTPYLTYRFHRDGQKDIYEIEQHFARPLQIIVRAKQGEGSFIDFAGSAAELQTIIVDHARMKQVAATPVASMPEDITTVPYMTKMGLAVPETAGRQRQVSLARFFNSNVDDIYRNEYLSPRPPFTTLQMPKQGIGQWCHPERTATIEDEGLRSKIRKGLFDTGVHGVRFLCPREGRNIVYTSLWDNYPDSITVPLRGRASHVWLMLAGSTNSMQSRIDNGIVTVTYTDGTTTVLPLKNPINWCPIEQDYYVDEFAFHTSPLRPYRIHLGSGVVSRDISSQIKVSGYLYTTSDADGSFGNVIPDGAAQMLCMPLEVKKKLKSLTLRTLSNDVVMGLMGVTLEEE